MRRAPHRRHQHRQPAHHGTGARSLGGQPDPVADPRWLFQPEGAGLALRQRQTCAEQIDKLQDLILRLLQLPVTSAIPETLQKIKAMRTRQFDESKSLDEQLAEAQRGCRRSLANMDIIATQRLFPGVEVEMAPPQPGRHRARPHPLRHPGRSAAADPLPGPALRATCPRVGRQRDPGGRFSLHSASPWAPSGGPARLR